MKKMSFALMLLLCATFLYAQKGKVTQASGYLTSGKFDQAKQLIDEAMEHESCVDFDKGYFTKGQIYQAIFESTQEEYKKLDQNALNVAVEAFAKVIQLDEKKSMKKSLKFSTKI